LPRVEVRNSPFSDIVLIFDKISAVIQELGREGILPFASFFASSKPYGAPLTGLMAQYLVSCTLLFAVPAGDAYQFLISCTFHRLSLCINVQCTHRLVVSSYCLSLVNALVSIGLLLLSSKLIRSLAWDPPFRAPKIIVVLFFLSNLFLVVVPFIPPSKEKKTYKNLPYWVRFHCDAELLYISDTSGQSHPVGGFAISLFGVAYWYIWAVWLPKAKGYRLQREQVVQDDGVPRTVFRKIPVLVLD